MENGKPPQVTNISFHWQQGADSAITVLWNDEEKVQKISPPHIMAPWVKGN
jgi:hypothetical protein